MNENEQKIASEAVEASPVAKTTRKSFAKSYILAGVIFVLIIVGALYLLEKEGRSSTNIFGSIIANQKASAVVAIVNEQNIINSDLDASINQYTQMAAAQGVDITSPESQNDIRKQALEVLVNTELLKQSASERDIEVTEEQVQERLEAIKTSLGGEEVLQQRMSELNITMEKLNKDIRDEMQIQALLDQVYTEANIVVTDEEIEAAYNSAGEGGAPLPELDQVKEEIRQSLTSAKQQSAIDSFLTKLKEEAQIEIVE